MNPLTRAGRALGLIEARSESEGAIVASDGSILPPPRSGYGSHVSPREALTLESVFRAFQVISIGVSQLSLGVWRRDEEISPTPSLIRRPDVSDGATREAFLESTTVDLAGTGEAFWRKHSTRPGDPIVSLEVMPSHEVTVYQDPKRHSRILYSWRGQELTTAQVQHLKFMRIPGALHGLGPIQAAAAGLSGAIDVRDYGANWFNSGDVPSGILSTEQPLNGTQAADYKKQWKETGRGGEVRVLGHGLSFAPIMLRPADAQFLESQQFSVTQIARLFGIPAGYLLAAVEGTSDTYSNQEQIDIAFVRFTLMTYLREIEAAFSSLLPHGQDARFKLEALLRTDTKTRYEAHEVALRIGLYDVAHAQRIEGLPLTGAPALPTAPAEQETNHA